MLTDDEQKALALLLKKRGDAPVVTTQKTGKEIKAQLLLARTAILLGLLLGFAADSSWFVLMLAGIVWLGVVKLARWWRYE